MRNGTEITVKYQYSYMLLVQLAASAGITVAGLVLFWWGLDKSVLREVISVIFMFFNHRYIYNTANKFAIQDNKPYTPLKNDLLKGALMGAAIAAITLILYGIDKLVWHFCITPEGGLSTWYAIVLNVIYIVWTFPYTGIMGMSHGYVTWYSVIIWILLPVISSFAGYYAGYKKINLTEKIRDVIYEKK